MNGNSNTYIRGRDFAVSLMENPAHSLLGLGTDSTPLALCPYGQLHGSKGRYVDEEYWVGNPRGPWSTVC
jgi:hypothetical protein